MVLLLLGCGESKPKTSYKELIGVWKSTNGQKLILNYDNTLITINSKMGRSAKGGWLIIRGKKVRFYWMNQQSRHWVDVDFLPPKQLRILADCPLKGNWQKTSNNAPIFQ